MLNASPPQSSPGNCDFGHGYDPHTWPTTAWIDSFIRLFEIYELEDRVGYGLELHLQIQQDWRIFSFDEPRKLRQFLVSAIQDEHPLADYGTKVRLKTTGEYGGTDPLLSWAQFSDEIRTRNRYFPQTVPDRKILERVLLESVEHIQKDIALYRARVFEETAPSAIEMGAPPAIKAAAGRANPVGIPYLYLSFALETCIYETRVANHTQVAIGTFHATRDLSVLNLADVEAPDFFDIEEVDSVAEQIRRVSFHRYLSALGHELKKPVRVSDQPTDYIPTQYLCELAKSLGLDGVLYSSSLHADGRNVVLFDVDAAACDHEIKVIEITSLSADWRFVGR
ncbi:RES family NAD+ phosphorylase [Humibacter albus]|uniref:RES family NAD+ phosphorylase n=1 Tax=Humibacter albus TaxID=427754 RepID=UPI0003B731D3|nr:RES family NAD+ phosphorylase [Humibacter albus]